MLGTSATDLSCRLAMISGGLKTSLISNFLCVLCVIAMRLYIAAAASLVACGISLFLRPRRTHTQDGPFFVTKTV
jgi:hypothetical protein